MPQILSEIIVVTNLQPQASIALPHQLQDASGKLPPSAVWAGAHTGITVVSSDENEIVFRNDGDVPDTVSFLAMRFHSTQGHLANPFLMEGRRSGETLWSAYKPRTIENTTEETSMFSGTAIGSLIIPANYFQIGRMARIRVRGYISTGSGQDSTFRIKLNGATLIENTGTLPNGLSNNYVESVFDLVCYKQGATGAIRGMGRTFIHTSIGVAQAYMRPLVMLTDAELDTTQAMAVDQTYQWANALPENSLTITHAMVKTLN